MDKFRESLKDLLNDCEKLLRPEKEVSSKWVLISDSQQQVKEEVDEKLSLIYSYARASTNISHLASYQACQKAFENDAIFKDAAKLAGYWGTFRAIFQDVIRNCGKIRKNKVILDIEHAVQLVNKLRKKFSASEVQFLGTSRLLGVKLLCKEIILPDGLSLYRLNKKERNDRQPLIQPYSSSLQDSQVSFHPTELRTTFTLPVNKSKSNAFFDANNEAQKVVRTAFTHVLDALLLIKEGQIDLGPQKVEGGPVQSGTIMGLYPNLISILNMEIRKKDITKITTAYELVSGKSDRIDKVMSSAFHRFLLGRKRRDLVDKIIDFVIAWESILLTQKGSPATQELSYRFSVNGSSLITYISKDKDRKKHFQKMKCAYDLRSSVVHGGDDKKINKVLESGKFDKLIDACNFLENNFKNAIWWLIEIEPTRRPYFKKDGWEELLWPQKQ
jgi:hypothetical protein